MNRYDRHLWGTITAAVLVATMAAPVLADGHAQTLVVFDAEQGELPEGVAVDDQGDVYASFATLGELVRIPAGTSEAESFGRIDGLAEGEFGPLGLALDAQGDVYAGVQSADPELNGVWRFEATSGDAERIPGTEGIAFANDVAFGDDGSLYMTDTITGAVWRSADGGPAEPWIEDPLLQGTGEAGFGFPLGANGITVVGDTVYVAVTEKAQVVAIPIVADGTAGEATVFAELPEAVDGIAVDAEGRLISTHPLANLVTRWSPDGGLEIIADEADGLDRPSSVALHSAEDGSTTAYVANFSVAMGTELGNGPSIVALEIGPAPATLEESAAHFEAVSVAFNKQAGKLDKRQLRTLKQAKRWASDYAKAMAQSTGQLKGWAWPDEVSDEAAAVVEQRERDRDVFLRMAKAKSFRVFDRLGAQLQKTGLSSARGVAALREALGLPLSDALREYLEQAEEGG